MNEGTKTKQELIRRNADYRYRSDQIDHIDQADNDQSGMTQEFKRLLGTL